MIKFLSGAPPLGHPLTAPPRKKKPREKRDPAATRQALLAAAAALFPESGYDGVSVEDLATRAGVNKALISYHFGGKRGLYVAVLESAFADMAERLPPIDEALPTPVKDSTASSQAFAITLRERPDFFALFLREAVSTGIDPAVVPHLLQIMRVTRRLAERGQPRGPVPQRGSRSLPLRPRGRPGFLLRHRAGPTTPGRRGHVPFDISAPRLHPSPRGDDSPGPRPRTLPHHETETEQEERSALMKRSAAVVLGTALLAAGCGRGDEDGRILASGHVEATEVLISTKVGGTLEHLAVDEGSTVEAGQELARIDTVDTLLALESAKAERALAQAELRLRLAGTRKEDILEAKAQLVRAEADLAGARPRPRAHGGPACPSGSGTTKSRDDARTRRDVAAASVEAARERLRRMEAGFRKEEIDAARARRQAADAGIARLEQQLEDAVIVQPGRAAS